jgi:hypothetical protein
MITLTALVGLLGLGWGIQLLWKRVAKSLAESKPAAPVVAPVRAP